MFSNKLKKFLQLEAAAGIILFLAAVVALLVANLNATAGFYHSFLSIPVSFRAGPLEINKTLLLVINDGLMAVFFLLVALEIKREVKAGELSSLKQMVLPGAAALCGVIIPALIYRSVVGDDAAALRGWAIPAATDIAFSLGVLALLGSRVPVSLKVFLTTVAVVDDLAAIVIIALFYTAELSWFALAMAALAIATLAVLNRRGVSRCMPYLVVGAVLWLCVLKSGVHATLAGVIVGLLIPFRGPGNAPASPAEDLEHTLHPWVAYGILPLFAFANSGVSFAGVTSDMIFSGVSLAILLGLSVGKPVAIFGCVALLATLGWSSLPRGVSYLQMAGIGMLAGIGFTMSLFIGGLAFEGLDAAFATTTKVGVFAGSLLSAVLGYTVLWLASVSQPASQGKS